VSKTSDDSRWENFDAVKACFERITLLETTRSELMAFGFDPYRDSNIQIHNYLALINKFMPNTNITKDDLPPGIRDCLESKESCIAYELKLQSLKGERYGNVILDLLKFKRQTHQSGWRFSAFIVMMDDVVVYKLWEGQPRIEGEVYQKNPLGPFQDPADMIVGARVLGDM
jgi:hypothetical protein